MHKECITTNDKIPVLQLRIFNTCMKCLLDELNSHNVKNLCEKYFKGSDKLQQVVKQQHSRFHEKHGIEYGTGSKRKEIK